MMRFIVIAWILFIPTALMAAENMHGIAMHGEPKYDEGFSHLSYTNIDATKGGTFTQCAIGTFDTLNDNNIKGKPAEGLYLLHDPLMRRVWDEPFSMYGVVAQSVDLPEDRGSITFHLNPNAIFHDGSKITVMDVEFSFNTLKEKGKPNTRNVYKLVDKVTIEDSNSIRFDFNDNHDRETALILAMMPVLSKTYWESRKFDATTLDAPLGNGPYKIKSVDTGKKIVFEKVTDYWAKNLGVNKAHYNFDELVFDYYRDTNVAIEAFKSGACDVRREFSPASWQVNYDDNADYITETLSHSRPEKAKGFIFNTRRPPLNDVRVRQALTIAFNFDWMNKTLFHGNAKRVESTFPNSTLASDFKLPKGDKRTMLKLAAALLDDAGWNIKDNKRFELSLILNNAAEEKIALGYANDLKRLGVILNIRTLDTAQFFGALNDYDYDMVSWRWVNSLSPGTEQAIYWGCDAAKITGSRNYAGICNADIDTAIANLAQAKTYDVLTSRAQALDKLIMNEYPFIPLYYAGVDYVARWPYIKHPETQSLYGMVLETWWRDTAQE
jgi:microcin C transport system substrate-binding protein